MKFTEETLEKAVIELFGELQIPHIQGQNIHRTPEDVLFQDDFRNYLEVRYSNEEITSSEIDSIIQKINESNADVLLVGLGMPKQELFLLNNFDKNNFTPRSKLYGRIYFV